MQKFYKWIAKYLTKNYTEIPLFWVNFNLNQYNQFGAKNSCTLKIHPELRSDIYIVETLNYLVDYIRDNYNMDKLSKC